jgi:hypothetical protein
MLNPYAFAPAEQLAGEDQEDRDLLREMAAEARTYLEGQPWCRRIAELRFGDGIGGVLAVFLAKVVPTRVGVDEWLWVVVGDIPPLYLVTDDIGTPREALEAYVEWRRAWVAAVRERRPLDDLPAVDAPPTRANADDLDGRLDYIERKIIPEWG